MPLSVDPILVFPLAASDAASIARCVGRIRCAFFEISSLPDSVGFQTGDLFGEDDRVDHHAVADDVDRAVPENARGNRVQHVLLALEVEGVPCVRAALEPGDHPVGGSEHVHDFPFSLVAPLQA